MPMAETWTEDRVVTLRRMIAEGGSGGQIAKALGLTRNQVIGKATRLKLSLSGSFPAARAVDGDAAKVVKAAPRLPQPKPVERRKYGPSSLVTLRSAPPEQAAAQAQEYLSSPARRHAFDPAGAPAGARLLPLADLERGMCKWPLFEDGPQIFCACTVTTTDKNGQPDRYCETHSQLNRGS